MLLTKGKCFRASVLISILKMLHFPHHPGDKDKEIFQIFALWRLFPFCSILRQTTPKGLNIVSCLIGTRSTVALMPQQSAPSISCFILSSLMIVELLYLWMGLTRPRWDDPVVSGTDPSPQTLRHNRLQSTPVCAEGHGLMEAAEPHHLQKHKSFLQMMS